MSQTAVIPGTDWMCSVFQISTTIALQWRTPGYEHLAQDCCRGNHGNTVETALDGVSRIGSLANPFAGRVLSMQPLHRGLPLASSHGSHSGSGCTSHASGTVGAGAQVRNHLGLRSL